MRFTVEEKCDIIETYILNGKNTTATRRAYSNQYPNRNIPTDPTVISIYKDFRDGNIKRKKTRDHSRGITLWKQNQIIRYFENNPQNSIRDAARDLRISYGSVARTLKKTNYHPYKVLPTQYLEHGDNEKRLEFCRTLLENQNRNIYFFKNILWTDEASFSTAGIFNRRNTHHWARENLKKCCPIKKQGRTSVGIWCGILGNKILGPIFFNGSLNGERYVNFIQNEIEDFLDDIALEDRYRIVWQQDGAPAHSNPAARQILNEKYPIWIGRYGTIPWPARSPDLTPLDFFLWGHLKTVVYKNRPQNIEDIKNKIRNEINTLNNTPEVFTNVRKNLRKRLLCCVEQEGNLIEHLLQ